MADFAAAGDEPASGLSGRESLRPLREHRAFIAVFVLSAMLSALALTYIYSERYRADATIFFKPSDVTEMNQHGQEALGSRLPVPTQKNLTQTITQLATSDVVLRRVVADLHLDLPKRHDTSGPWYRHYYKKLKYAVEDYADDIWKVLKYGEIINDPVTNAVYRLYKSVKITNDDSYVYTVAVTAETPAEAAQRTDHLVAVLTQLLQRDDRLAFEHRTAELVRLRDQKAREIESIEAAIQTLLATNRVASIDEELKSVTERLSKLRQQWADAQADLDQSNGKAAASAEKLRVPLPTGEYGSPTSAHTSRISPDDYGKLTTKKLDSEVDSRGLRGRLAAIEHSYTELVPRIQVLTDVEAQEDLLAAKLASAKRDYSALTDSIAELAIRQTTGQSELHVQAKADGSIQPVSPIKIYHVLAATLLAGLVAVGLAYVLDYFEIRLFLPPAGGRSKGSRRVLPEAALEPSLAPGAAD
jgi:uncharacterized protein involved in exopolysaccharide biosynthesis